MQFAEQPTNVEIVQRLRKQLEFVGSLSFPVVLWEVQNTCYAPLIKALEELRPEADKGNPAANTTLAELVLLRDKLRIKG
jgi:hypothetical protein